MWRIGLAFLIGQCCIHSLSSLPRAWPLALLLAVAFIVAGYFRLSVVVACLLGIGWAWGNAYLRLAEDLPTDLEGADLLVRGRVASILDMRNLDPQFDFEVEHASDSRVPERVKLAWYDTDLRPQPGELWQFVVRLKRRNGFANPGGFDYEGYLFRSGIGATGYIRTDERNGRLGEAGEAYGVLRARAWLAARIRLAVGDSPMLGILQGLAVGDTQAMLPAQWRVFAATGTSHLMAISGLHISMVAALAAMAGGLIVCIPRAQACRLTVFQGQAIAGIAAAVGYALLAGMSVPTQRTLLMLCIYFLARWSRRALSVGNALGCALLGVLLLDPFAVLSVGAWLSFGAVAVIVLATGGRLRADRRLVGFARVQWGVTIGLLPILVMAFGGVSLVSPIANAVAVPLFTLVLVPLTLLGAGVASLSVDLGSVLLGWAAQVLTACWPALKWLADQPLAMWYLPDLPRWHCVLMSLGAIVFVLPSVWPLRLAGLALCLPVALFRPERPELGAFELTMLDVGQGLAVVVMTRSHTLVYDAGPAFRTGRDTGELVVLPYLHSKGIRAIDRLVISHGDLDHQGGLRSLTTQMQTRALMFGPSVVFADQEFERCERGRQWVWDGVVFEVLHPQSADVPRSDNDSSCVLRITGKAGSALLTGDIESDGERELFDRGLRPVDVVSVAHHGSRSSSTQEFIEAADAKLALVSAGYRNRWSFPKTDVIARWRGSGAEIASTIESGAIEVSIPASGKMSVRHYRSEGRRYWSSR